MIRIDKLYGATNQGLDIILHYYPQAREVVGTKNKFRVRPQDKTPSACLYLCQLKDGGEVWKVTDFGDEGHAESPLDICMKVEGIDRPYEAVLKLAAMFDVRDELDRSVNKPEIKHRAAAADEKDGTRIFSLMAEIPEGHLKVLGPRVTRDDVEALHWYEAEYVGWVKNREVTLKYSTENYPIFMRECVVEEASGAKAEVKFYKIYEPLNPDKGFRFSYHPAGGKPKEYINGLHELKRLWRKMNAEAEAAFYNDPANDGKPYREQKLKEAFICSGERDSLCCHSMGYSPLWFNSETYRLSEAEYKEVMKYVEVLYNIPDLDSTGVRKGEELALRFIDIHTMWLPQYLTTYRDNRGRPRKDLRDWMELRDRRSDFAGLMALAMPAKFWTERVNRKTGAVSYDIDTECLYNFLRLNGFYTLHDDNIKESRYIHVDGNIVREVKAKDLRRFISEWAEQRCLPRPVRNLIHNSPRLSDSALDNLREVELDFTNYTPTTQLFFFPGKTIEATPTGLVEHAGGDGLERYVWQENVLEHRVHLLPPMFEVERSVTPSGETRFGVKVKDSESSPLFGYVINTSRTYWRKELEYNFADRDAAEAEAYRRGHKFCIDGEGLTDDERREQEQNLVSKLFAIGYMLHHYKSPSRAWAPMAMDNKIGEDGECNGRSGKSFLFKALSLFMKTVKLSGRNAKLMDNPHVFDQVTQHTDFVLVDDCDRHLGTEQFYDLITSDMTVNPKNNQSYTIPFELSPKFGFTTNYVPRDFDASTEARLLYLVFSDYYHQRTESNDYLETRSIRDDFGRDLISSSYSEADWNADINFFMQYTQFYLSLCTESIKPMPPMGNILKRKFKADMGTNFEEWANVYFSEDGDHLDTFIVRREAYEAFIDDAKVNKNFYTMNKFTKALRSFAALCPYVYDYNPADLQNSQGRISRRIDGKSEDMIYLRSTKSAANREQLADGAHLNDGADFVPDETEEAPF